MYFVGRRPLMVLHRKLSGKKECVCGAKLKIRNGEYVHPRVDIGVEVSRVKRAWIRGRR